MSSSLKDLQCIAVCEVEVSSVIQNKYHSPAEWAGCRVTDSHPPTNEPCRQTFAAHGRPRLSYREHHWVAPMRLTAAQPGPWLWPVNLQPLSEQNNTHQAKPRDIRPTQEDHETDNNEFRSQYPRLFFSSSVADVALMARSLHVSKQTKLCTRTKKSLK